jgi:hypothetical protein
MSALRLAARLGAVAVTCTALMSPGAALGAATVRAAPHKGILPPKNPSKSLSPSPMFLDSAKCFHGKDTSACNTLVLKAITNGRKVLEKLGGLSFSLSAYEKLPPIEQLFVTVNLERTARGLAPATVLTRSLDKVAQVGAVKDEDPPLSQVPTGPLPGGGHWIGLGANWAGGWDNALGSDYGWVYDDGPGSDNGDCTKTDKHGCWGHRDNILGTFSTRSRCGGASSELAMGAGHVAKGKKYGDSETELFAGVCGRTPTDVVISWTKAKKLLHVK